MDGRTASAGEFIGLDDSAAGRRHFHVLEKHQRLRNDFARGAIATRRGSPSPGAPAVSSAPKSSNAGIPIAHRARFAEIAALLGPFGQAVERQFIFDSGAN